MARLGHFAVLPLLMASQVLGATNRSLGCIGNSSNSSTPCSTSIPLPSCSPLACQPCWQHEAASNCTVECDMFFTCSGHGRCMGSTGQCICYQASEIDNETTAVGGWSGAACDVPPYDPCQDCQTCEQNNASCGCQNQCDMFVNCNGNGRCRGSTGDCECYQGFAGPDCSVPILQGCPLDCHLCGQDSFDDECIAECGMFETCSGHGRCRGSTGECACYPGWIGPACDVEECPVGFARLSLKKPCYSVCGDGILSEDDETCDDGNKLPYDGCSSACTIECGWECTLSGCSGICGDGMRKGNEECDDFNQASGDGCSSECTVEPGYSCAGALGPVNVCFLRTQLFL
jgi:cysteine-rich repeat protein